MSTRLAFWLINQVEAHPLFVEHDVGRRDAPGTVLPKVAPPVCPCGLEAA